MPRVVRGLRVVEVEVLSPFTPSLILWRLIRDNTARATHYCPPHGSL
jgi:hypothetical protein